MSDDPLVEALLEAIDEASSPLRLVLAKCVQVTPLLVSINGIGSVPAVEQGITMALNDVAYALWAPPGNPVVIAGVAGAGGGDPAGTAAALFAAEATARSDADATEASDRTTGDADTLASAQTFAAARAIAMSIALGG